MAKTNYNQARRQKEIARKQRQQEKLARKLARVAPDAETSAESPAGQIVAVPPIEEKP